MTKSIIVIKSLRDCFDTLDLMDDIDDLIDDMEYDINARKEDLAGDQPE
jgi:hypothetical protein